MKGKDFLLGIGIAFLACLVVFALFGPGYSTGFLTQVKPFMPAGSPGHILGTDQLGRDELAQLAYGARVSLSIGLLVQSLSLATGILVAMFGTFSPKWIRITLMRFTDSMFAFPDILLAILIVGMLQAGNFHVAGKLNDLISSGIIPVIVALGITAWPAYSRLVHTQVASLKDREFVVAAKALGAPTPYIVIRHILPQLWGILLAVSMVDLAGTILAESTLSFLGIGVLPPYPSWGSMIETARNDMQSHPTWLVWPCLFLSLTIFALNFVGDGLRSVLDPRGK